MYPSLENLTKLIRTVRKDLPDAVIAGGAARDIYLGRTPRDIDIFYAQGEKQHVKQLFTTCSMPGDRRPDTMLKTNRAKDLPYRGIPFDKWAILDVWTAVVACPPVQLIQLDEVLSPQELVPAFSATICQAWIDSSGLHTTPAFRRDQFDKVLRFTNPTRKSYGEKMQARFPQWHVTGKHWIAQHWLAQTPEVCNLRADEDLPF